MRSVVKNIGLAVGMWFLAGQAYAWETSSFGLRQDFTYINLDLEHLVVEGDIILDGQIVCTISGVSFRSEEKQTIPIDDCDYQLEIVPTRDVVQLARSGDMFRWPAKTITTTTGETYKLAVSVVGKKAAE